MASLCGCLIRCMVTSSGPELYLSGELVSIQMGDDLGDLEEESLGLRLLTVSPEPLPEVRVRPTVSSLFSSSWWDLRALVDELVVRLDAERDPLS